MDRSDRPPLITAEPRVRRFTPIRIAGGYLAFGLLWIWLTDRLLIWVGLAGDYGFWISALKGTVFVLLSAGLVFLLVRRELRGVSQLVTLLQAVSDGTTDAVYVKDLQGRYLFFNQAAAKFVNREVADVIGKDDSQLFDGESAARIRDRDQRIMETGISETDEEVLTAAGVTRTYLATKAPYRDHDGRIVGLVGISHDMTERKRLEDQYRQAQKMEAIGQLAGGVAHDFNNLLTIINGYSELLLETLAEGAGRDMVSQIHNAGLRSAGLTRQLLAFSRKQVWSPVILDLNEIVQDTEKMLRRVIGEDIELRTLFEAARPFVKADPGQLEQVLLNLAVNARDAMPRGGQLTIATHDIYDSTIATTPGRLTANAYVVLTVADSGEGMPDEIKERVFEPFFTTKGAGRGTGLGLAVVHGIVKQTDGFVDVESELGRGTTFRIFLPVCREEPRSSRVQDKGLPTARGGETILLVEDEEALRGLIGKVLCDCGYCVLEAASSDQALSIAQSHTGRLDLLVTDVVMPGKGGRLLAEELSQMRPELQILYVSGYTDDAVVRHGIEQDKVNFLQKPFAPTVLAHRIRDLLDSGKRVCSEHADPGDSD